jgi:hypothetical protein
VLRHVTRERRSPDSSFASLPSIASRALTARPRVKPQPVWRLRAGRAAAAVSMAVVAIAVVVVAALSVHWETPYRVVSKAAKPIEGRIHFGKDNDTPPVANAHPAKASARLQQRRQAVAKSSSP